MVTLLDLPDELIHSCIGHLSSISLVIFARASKRCYELAIDPYFWRKHCLYDFKYWSSNHAIERKRSAPVSETAWRALFLERQAINKAVIGRLNSLIEDDSNRIEKINDIAVFEEDAKDVLLRNLRAHNQEDDVLARRYYSQAVLSYLNRLNVCRLWMDLRKRRMLGRDAAPEIPPHKALCSFDVFMSSEAGDEFRLLQEKIDAGALEIRNDIQDWDALPSETKAVKVAEYLYLLRARSRDRPFNPLKGCFIFRSSKEGLGSESAELAVSVIYCALADRLGLEARVLSFGWIRVDLNTTSAHESLANETKSLDDEKSIWLDPCRTTRAMTQDEFKTWVNERTRFVFRDDESFFIPLEPIRMLHVLANEIKSHGIDRDFNIEDPIDYAAARYGCLWLGVILNPGEWTDGLADEIPMSHAQDIVGRLKTTPEDWQLFMEFIMPLFARSPHLEDLVGMLNAIKRADKDPRPVKSRSEATEIVQHHIGQMIRHRRYGWEGVITGWDMKCTEGDAYCQAYGVYGLPNGRNQPFYQVLTEVDGVARSSRYVAQDNALLSHGPPSNELKRLAGQKFKRWDASNAKFISNIRHEYPDD